jgi:hypothetical protein
VGMLLDRVAKLVVVMPRQHTPVRSFGVITLARLDTSHGSLGLPSGIRRQRGEYPAAADRAQPPNEHSGRALADQTGPDSQHSRTDAEGRRRIASPRTAPQPLGAMPQNSTPIVHHVRKHLSQAGIPRDAAPTDSRRLAQVQPKSLPDLQDLLPSRPRTSADACVVMRRPCRCRPETSLRPRPQGFQRIRARSPSHATLRSQRLDSR